MFVISHKVAFLSFAHPPIWAREETHAALLGRCLRGYV